MHSYYIFKQQKPRVANYKLRLKMQQTVYNLFCKFTTDVLLELKSDILFMY